MKQKDPQKLERIYAATCALVARVGLAGLTMAAVGKEAGMGMGTLYVYHQSKEELVNALFKRLKRAHAEHIYQALRPGAPFMANLQALVGAYLKHRMEHFEAHFFIEQCAQSHFLDEEAARLQQDTLGEFYRLLDQGRREMLVKPYENALLAAFALGGATALAALLRAQGQACSEEWAQRAFELCWDSIKR